MVYHTKVCPYCGFVLQFHDAHHTYETDSELLPCPKCRNLIKTGNCLWDKKSGSEISSFYLKRILVALIAPIVFTGIVYSLILYISKVESTSIVLPIIIFIFSIPWTLWNNLSDIKEIKQLDFEKALLRHWKIYDSECDSMLEEYNPAFIKLYNKDFFELEKHFVSDEVYEKNKYNTLNERISFLIDNYLFKDKEKIKKAQKQAFLESNYQALEKQNNKAILNGEAPLLRDEDINYDETNQYDDIPWELKNDAEDCDNNKN